MTGHENGSTTIVNNLPNSLNADRKLPHGPAFRTAEAVER